MKNIIIASLIALSAPAIGCAGADIAGEPADGHADHDHGNEQCSAGHAHDADRGMRPITSTGSGEGANEGGAGAGGDVGDESTGNESTGTGTGGGDVGGGDVGGGDVGGGDVGGGDGAGGGCSGEGGNGAGGGGACETGDCTPDPELPRRTCYVVDGNPTCASEGLGVRLIKIDPVVAGLHFDADVDVDVATDGTVIDYTVSTGVTAVIVKGGPNAMVCVYDSVTTIDADLTAPINEQNGTPYGLSHVDFCRAE